MRRLMILLALVGLLAASFELSRLVADWHYVVPAEPGALLYATGFEDGPANDDWEQTVRQAKSQEIVDGRMRLTVNESLDGVFSAAGPYFGDFDLVVEATTLDGPLDNGFGVVFRVRDDANYLMFLISADGFYRVKRVRGGFTRVISNWHGSPHIETGIGAVNQLRVTGQGDAFRFYINGQPVELCIPDDPEASSTPLADGRCLDGQWVTTLTDASFADGRLGVTVEIDQAQPPGVVVGFDNFVVTGPQPIAAPAVESTPETTPDP